MEVSPAFKRYANFILLPAVSLLGTPPSARIHGGVTSVVLLMDGDHACQEKYVQFAPPDSIWYLRSPELPEV
jgi:hypothetical protein